MTEEMSAAGGQPAKPSIDPLHYRDVLGHFATGVTVITAADGDTVVGMAANSFTSVSLDPPLVSFCAAHSSTTYPRIRAAGTFCVNILSEDQHAVARLFAQRGANRFDAMTWKPAACGAPILDGVLCWVECTIHAELPAGDHTIVLGEVVDLAVENTKRPLVFYRGKFGVEVPAPWS